MPALQLEHPMASTMPMVGMVRYECNGGIFECDKVGADCTSSHRQSAKAERIMTFPTTKKHVCNNTFEIANLTLFSTIP